MDVWSPATKATVGAQSTEATVVLGLGVGCQLQVMECDMCPVPGVMSRP